MLWKRRCNSCRAKDRIEEKSANWIGGKSFEVYPKEFNNELKEEKTKIESSKDIVDILMPRMRDLKKEIFKAVMLDSQNKILDIVEITKGTVNQVIPVMREIFHKALELFAVKLICVHNHPSGDAAPSKKDDIFTYELIRAGRIIGINVIDHIIIGNNEYFSFLDKGKI